MSAAWEDLERAFTFAADMIQAPDTPDWIPMKHQIPPPPPWFAWVLMGGRGSGKTATAAKYLHDHVYGPPCLPGVPGGHWIGVVAPTLGDAVTSCVNGPSGLRKWDPGVRVVNEVGGAVIRWSNGAQGKLFGAHKPEDVERFRAGGNRCFVWAEEAAAWRYLDDAWQQIRYGLRIGPRPHAIVSTTPKARKLIKEWTTDPDYIVTHGVTADNPHLDAKVKEMLYADYANTRMGRQELLGELLEDIPGALWKQEMIDPYRIGIEDMPNMLDRVVVGVDPQIKNEASSNETGIVVVAMVRRWNRPNIAFPHLPHAFVLEDHSGHYTARRWAEKVSQAFHESNADRVIAEVNNGGDLVKANVHNVDAALPIKDVHASRGKQRRAEPISALYEQGRVHHVGVLAKLEDQMMTWDAEDPDPAWSPDRMDALVWALWELMVGRSMVRKNVMKDRRLSGRR
jgi:phage terminase large subunit-like protein